MVDPAVARTTLSRLAAGDHAPGYADVIERAATAVDDVDAAAAFVADGGLQRLSRAVDAAETAGDRERTRRGQRVLSTFERFRRAARPESERVARRDRSDRRDSERSNHRDPERPARRDLERPTSRGPSSTDVSDPRPDQFRSGRGNHLTAGGKPSRT